MTTPLNVSLLPDGGITNCHGVKVETFRVQYDDETETVFVEITAGDQALRVSINGEEVYA